MTRGAVSPAVAAAPSDPVARATVRILHNLTNLRNARGDDTAQIEAMAMHGAALAFLRPTGAPGLVTELLTRALQENARLLARDAEMVAVGDRRRAAQPARRAKA